jgi:KUP system potassium uptake protein
MLVIGALGVVYGDIGTSPLYALRLCFNTLGAFTQAEVFGVLSLIAWTVFIIVTIKYVIVVMRADNGGEGGILALTALSLRVPRPGTKFYGCVLTAGLLGAALFYGDGVITPAISVLSAVEGLRVATEIFNPFIVPIALAILFVLFQVQRFGVASLGSRFGVVMLIWFLVIGVAGALQIVEQPEILLALNPVYGLELLGSDPRRGFAVLGAVVLAVTGAEALYADMGQFGKGPIRVAWLSIVFPAVILNYFGQGALLLHDHAALKNPFFSLVPNWGLYPMVGLATVATVIAAQAVISGAFSMTQQAMLLGYLPRFKIIHTSSENIGQIYAPAVNLLLMLSVIGLVLLFRGSDRLGGAYGIAVTGTMLLTTFLAFVYMVGGARWRLWLAIPVFSVFLIVDLTFFFANTLKIADGGWFPIAVAAIIFTIMVAWLRGSEELTAARWLQALNLDQFLAALKPDEPRRVPGTAVFMSANDDLVPPALLANLEANHILHERNLLMHVKPQDFPHIAEDMRINIRDLGQNFHAVEVKFGFMDEPDIPRALAELGTAGFAFDLNDTRFFVGREKIVVRPDAGLWSWRKRLFIFMHLIMLSATEYYRIPTNQVIQIGGETEI